MHHIRGKCDLLHGKTGKCADNEVDSKVEFHFNALLDAISEWRCGKALSADISLEGTVSVNKPNPHEYLSPDSSGCITFPKLFVYVKYPT